MLVPVRGQAVERSVEFFTPDAATRAHAREVLARTRGPGIYQLTGCTWVWRMLDGIRYLRTT